MVVCHKSLVFFDLPNQTLPGSCRASMSGQRNAPLAELPAFSNSFLGTWNCLTSTGGFEETQRSIVNNERSSLLPRAHVYASCVFLVALA